MRIVILHSRYLSGDLSGENRVVEDERRALEEAGHEVISWEPEYDDSDSLITSASRAVWSRTNDGAVRSMSRRFRPDIIHAHNLYPALSPSVLRIGDEMPVVMTLHNFRLMCLPATFLRNGSICEACRGKVPWRGVIHGCYRGSTPASAVIATSLVTHRLAGTFKRVALFGAMSAFARDKLIQGGLPSSRIRVRRNYSNAMERREGHGSYFLVLGRLSEEKGVETAIRAWQGVGRLLVVGDGPDATRLASIAPPGVEFVGSVGSDDVPRLLRGARALLVPSRSYEGSPRVVIEALAAGVPVVASRIGGLPEHVEDGVNGFLVDATDVPSWAAAMAKLGDDATSERLGAAAYRRWEREFAPEPALRALEAFYEEAIAGHRSGSLR